MFPLDCKDKCSCCIMTGLFTYLSVYHTTVRAQTVFFFVSLISILAFIRFILLSFIHSTNIYCISHLQWARQGPGDTMRNASPVLLGFTVQWGIKLGKWAIAEEASNATRGIGIRWYRNRWAGTVPSLRDSQGKGGPGVWGGQRAVKNTPGPAQLGNKGNSLVVHADPRSQGFVSSLKRVDFILRA